MVSINENRTGELTQELYDRIGTSCVCLNLRKATRLVTQVYDRALKPTGLKATQFTLLVSIGGLSGLSLSRLARPLRMDRTTLSRNAALLHRKGLIHIVEGEDRREQRLFLTEKGKGVLRRAIPLWLGIQGQLYDEVGKENVERLFQGLRSLAGTKA